MVTKAPRANEAGPKPRLLVLDDEEAILWPVAKFFRGLGWDVVACEDAAEAEELLETQEFAMVVLDLALSPFGREGLDVLRAVRRHRPRLPVVILSANVSPEVEVQANELGAGAVLKKPLALTNLAQVVLALTSGS